jgi:hypothetical protein
MTFIKLYCSLVFLGISFFSMAQMPSAADSLHSQATRMENAFIRGDFVSYIQYFPPKFIAAKGGQDSVVKRLAEGRKQMTGILYDSIGFDTPATFINENSLLQVILGEHISVTIGHNRVLMKTDLICLSADNGAHWNFLESGEEGGINQLRIWLPDISEKLTVPPQAPPQIFPKP